MLVYSDYPVAFNASQTLTADAKRQGWLRVNEVKDQVTALQRDPYTNQYVETDYRRVVALLRLAAD